jgi:hypothetical protein
MAWQSIGDVAIWFGVCRVQVDHACIRAKDYRDSSRLVDGDALPGSRAVVVSPEQLEPSAGVAFVGSDQPESGALPLVRCKLSTGCE